MPGKNDETPERAEPWEMEAVHREFPTRTEEQLKPAIEKCKRQMRVKNRRKLAECVSDKIRT